MNAIAQLAEGQQILRDHNVDMDAARRATVSVHPRTAGNVTHQDMVLAAAAYSAAHAPRPVTKESLAKYIADRSGAFPWEGPVGNGLTLEHYQERFREMAADDLFLAQQMGLPLT